MSADEKPGDGIVGAADPESGDANDSRPIETIHRWEREHPTSLGEVMARYRRDLVTCCPIRSPWPGLVVTKSAIHLRARGSSS